MDYRTLDAQLQGRNKDRRKITNNTYAIRQGEDIALRLHNTDVVIFKANGDKTLNSGGYHTHTTKDRINMSGVRLSQERGVWYVHGLRFQDGMTIKANGSIKGGKKDDSLALKADKTFKAKARAYAKLYSDALPLDRPACGDCWFCFMKTQNGDTLGDAFRDKPS